MLKKNYNKSILIIFLVLIVAFLLQYIEFFNSFFLTDKVSESFPLSPLTILTFIIFVDSILLELIKKPDKNLKLNLKRRTVLSLALYMILVMVGIVLIILIRWIYFKSNLDFEVEALFDIRAKELFWFFIFLLLFITYLIFSIFIYLKIDKLDLSVKFRLGIVFLIIIFISIIAFVFIPFSLVLPVILSFLIYLFVLDIYIDQKSLNSTWIFTWMIIIAGFTSLIVFSAYSDYTHQKD